MPLHVRKNQLLSYLGPFQGEGGKYFVRLPLLSLRGRRVTTPASDGPARRSSLGRVLPAVVAASC